LNLFEIFKSIYYKPGFYDPSGIGWAITAAYFLAAFFCLWTGLAEKKWAMINDEPANNLLWFGSAVLLLILGINKQLDLIQTLVILLGRGIAKEYGWYSSRGEVRLAFVILAALCALLLFSGLLWRIRKSWRQYSLVLLGLGFVIGFLAIRTASFNDVDYPLSQWRVIGHLRMKYVVELGGVLMVGAGACYSRIKCKAERLKVKGERRKDRSGVVWKP
jgi:hypothetical protein